MFGLKLHLLQQQQQKGGVRDLTSTFVHFLFTSLILPAQL